MQSLGEDVIRAQLVERLPGWPLEFIVALTQVVLLIEANREPIDGAALGAVAPPELLGAIGEQLLHIGLPPQTPLVSFGHGSQIGDVTIGDVAGVIFKPGLILVVPPQPVPTVRTSPKFPAGLRTFTGRTDEINKIETGISAALEKGERALCVIHGMGGIGKTTLAEAAAIKLAPHCSGGFIRLDLPFVEETQAASSIADAMGKVIRALGQQPVQDRVALAEQYQSCLGDARVLVLADNAYDAKQVTPLIPPRGSAMIVTSRQRLHFDGVIDLSLGLLPDDASGALIRAICGERLEQEKQAHGKEGVDVLLEQVVQLCGRLPLALRISASVIRGGTPGLREFVRALDNETTRLGKLDDRRDNITATLNVSYAVLKPHERDTLCQLGVFRGAFRTDSARTVVVLPSGDPGEVIVELSYRSLVEERPAPEGCGYSGDWVGIHDLVRVFAFEKLRATGQANIVMGRHAQHYAEVLGDINQLFDQGYEASVEGQERFSAEWSNIVTGQIWAEFNARNDPTASELCSRYALAGATQLRLRSTPSEQIAWHTAAVDAARRHDDRKLTAIHLCDLAAAYKARHEFHQALRLLEDALALARELGDQALQARGQIELAGVHDQLRQTDQAAACLQQAAPLVERLEGLPARRLKVALLTGRGVVALRKQQYYHASDCFGEALQIARVLGDLSAQAFACTNLGYANERADRLLSSIEHYRAAYELLGQIIDNPTLKMIEWEFGSKVKDMILHVEDREHFRSMAYNSLTHSLQLYQRDLGAEHPDMARLHRTVGDFILSKQGMDRPAEAVPLLERALQIDRRLGKFKDEELAVRLHTLGEQLNGLREWARAQVYLEETVTLYECLLPSTSPRFINPLIALGLALARQGYYEKAQLSYERAHLLCQHIHPPQHFYSVQAGCGLAECRHFLAEQQIEEGRLDEAAATADEAHALRSQLLGPNHAETQASLQLCRLVATRRTHVSPPLFARIRGWLQGCSLTRGE